MMNIGEKLKYVRKALGKNQGSIATDLGTNAGRVCRYERGEMKPTQEILEKFCTLYGVNREWLCGENVSNDNAFSCDYDKESVAERLKELRKKTGMTQMEFCKFLNIPRSTLATVETANARLSEQIAARIAEKCGVGIKWLMYGDESQREYPVDRKMIDWLWEHPEIREELWKQMNRGK